MLALVAAPSLAGAHGDDGEMSITTLEQVGADVVRIEAGIVYANDEDLAVDATVTATLTGTDGRVVGPITLEREAGESALYVGEATVPSPGTWEVAVSSTSPSASATGTIDVTATTPTTNATSTTAAPAPSTTVESPGTTAAPGDDTAADDDESSGVPVLAVVLGALIVLGLVAAAALRGRDDREG